MSVSESVTVCDSCVMLCWMSSNDIIEIHIQYSYLSVFHVVGVRWKPASALLCSVQNIYLLECLQFGFSFCKQYTLIKACHLRSNEYIYCNVSIFRRWIWLRNSLCSRGTDNVSWKFLFVCFFSWERAVLCLVLLSLGIGQQSSPEGSHCVVLCNVWAKTADKKILKGASMCLAQGTSA